MALEIERVFTDGGLEAGSEEIFRKYRGISRFTDDDVTFLVLRRVTQGS
jgi:hypothetical protein